MASLTKKRDCKNWIACFTLPDGTRTNRSTGTRNRKLAKQLAAEYKRPLVHPFEGATTWSGHASLVQEVDEQLAELGKKMDAIVCCVGGGGLLAPPPPAQKHNDRHLGDDDR